ncbi:MAG: hypothetical protein J07HX64_00409 [halophilic archaeon J07HX64]|nr:MAG: hypothetical protein J07HX64_00409 [halophilic archaeon J07HX64]
MLVGVECHCLLSLLAAGADTDLLLFEVIIVSDHRHLLANSRCLRSLGPDGECGRFGVAAEQPTSVVVSAAPAD